MNYNYYSTSMPQETVTAQCKYFHKQKYNDKEKKVRRVIAEELFFQNARIVSLSL